MHVLYTHTHTLNSIETIKCGEIKKQEAKNSYLTSFFLILFLYKKQETKIVSKHILFLIFIEQKKKNKNDIKGGLNFFSMI